MIEFYAKIVAKEKTIFKYQATIWKSSDGIDSIEVTKNFILFNMAKRWSIKKITKYICKDGLTIFIREKDIIRRKWND